jgi:hypothetical protein
MTSFFIPIRNLAVWLAVAVGVALCPPVASSSMAPGISYGIGQYFKEQGTEGSAAHLLAHAILGGAVAAAGGNDALTGALAAGGAEAIAPILSNYLYGKDASDLDPEQKETLSAIASLAGNAIGGMTGNGAADVAAGGQAARAAVENNRMLTQNEARILAKLKQNKSGEEQWRLNAAACALVRCADGVPEDDPDYAQLSRMQQEGWSYTAEIETLMAISRMPGRSDVFIYDTWDKLTDFRTRHDEFVTRGKGLAQLLGGELGVVGGYAIASASAGGCAPTLGATCLVGVPLGAGVAALSYEEAQKGSEALLGSYAQTWGQSVLDSFNPQRADPRNPLIQDSFDLLVVAAEAALAKGAGKVLEAVDNLPAKTANGGGNASAPVTSGGTANAATYPALVRQLTLESAKSPFTPIGGLTFEAINNAKKIPGLGPGELANPNIPSGFGKYTTETFQSPYGDFQVHFYKNPTTGEVLYNLDYKVIFNKMSGVSKKP